MDELLKKLLDQYVQAALVEAQMESDWGHADARTRNALVMKAVFEQARNYDDKGTENLRYRLFDVLYEVENMLF